MHIPQRVVDRVLGGAVRQGDCLIAANKPNSEGYVKVQWRSGRQRTYSYAHRVAWVAANGPIPDGMTVHHACFEPRCIAPAHLTLLTLSENSRRIFGRDWEGEGLCARGHPDSERIPNGRWVTCGPCRRDSWRRAYHKRKEATC